MSLPPLYGARVQRDLPGVGASTDATLRLVERAAFRLAGLALSHWSAHGGPDRPGLLGAAPKLAGASPLALGDAVEVIQACTARAPALPAEKLALPAVGRLARVVDGVAVAAREPPAERVRSPRFDLAGAVAAAACAKARPMTLAVALREAFVRLRNLEGHLLGRPQAWVDEHPGYQALFAPLAAAAAEELLGHPEVTTPFAGRYVARLDDASARGRGRTTFLTFTPDADGLQAAFCAVPVAEALRRPGASYVVRADGGGGSVVPEMPFLDLSRGVPQGYILDVVRISDREEAGP